MKRLLLFILMMLLSVGVVSADFSDDAKIYYSYDVDTEDMQFQGTNPKGFTGKLHGAVDFDGIDDYVRTDDSDPFDGNIFTLTTWVRMDSLVSARAIAGNGNLGGEIDLLWQDDSGGSQGFICRSRMGGSSRNAETGTAGFSSDTWYHIGCVVVDNGTDDSVSIYVNGELNDSISGDFGAITDQLDPFVIGERSGLTGNNLNGKVDEVGLWNVALNDNEISEIYQAGTPQNRTNQTRTANLLFYSSMDNLYDYTENNNQATLENDVVLSVSEAKIGTVFEYDNNDGIDTGYTASSNFTSSFSFNVWVNHTGSENDWVVNAESSDGNDDGLGILITTGNEFQFRVRNSGGTDHVASGTRLSNKYQMVTGIFNGSDILLYINGSLADSTSFVGSLAQPLANFFIGQRHDDSNYMTGYIDEFGYWERALTQSEISELYNNHKGYNPFELEKPPTPNYWTPRQLNTEAWWDAADTDTINHSGGNVLDWADKSGNNNDLMSNDLTEDLQRFYKLDGTSGPVVDSSGNSEDGTNNGPTRGVEGKVNNSFRFDGTNDVVDIPNTGYTETTNFTISTWVKTNSSKAFSTIFRFQGLTHAFGIENGNNLAFWENPDTLSGSAVPSIDDGNWHHVAVVRSGLGAGQTTFYFDGEPAGTVTANSAASVSGNFQLGYSGWPGDYFDGKMDEFRLYDSAKSQSDIKSMALQYPKTGNTTINGLNTVLFSENRMFTDTLSLDNEHTIFTVAYTSSTNGYRELIRDINEDEILHFGQFNGAVSNFYGDGSSWADVIANTPTNSSTVASVRGITANGLGDSTPYYNGFPQNNKSCTMVGTTTGFSVGAVNSKNYWDGPIAEIVIVASELSTEDRQKTEGYLAWKWGLEGDLPVDHPYKNSPPILSTIFGVDLISPQNNTINNTRNITFTFDLNATVDNVSSFELFTNETGTWQAEKTNTTPFTGNGTYSFVHQINNGTKRHLWNVQMNFVNGSKLSAPNNYTLIIDELFPFISTNLKNNTIVENQNVSFDVNVSDDIILSKLNVTLNGNNIYFNDSLSSPTHNISLTINNNNLTLGRNTLTIQVSDGHTAKELIDRKGWSIGKGWFGEKVEYNIKGEYKKKKIEFYENKKSKLDRWQVKEKFDRFSEVYKPSREKTAYTFIVESENEPIQILQDKRGNYGGQWLIIGEHWKDFVIKDQPQAKLELTRINDYKVSATISNLKPHDVLEFESTGDLNVETKTFAIYKINTTQTYISPIIAGMVAKYTLAIETGNTSFGSLMDGNAFLQIDGSNFTPVKDFKNSTFINFSLEKAITDTGSSYNITFNWFFNYSMVPSDPLRFPELTQEVKSLEFGVCTGSRNIPVYNFNYSDQINGSPIEIDASQYTMEVETAIKDFNFTQTFTNSNISTFCTNIPDTLASVDFDMTGYITLTESDYITRTVTFNDEDVLEATNSQETNTTLYLISSADSTSVTFYWQTSTFQPIDGDMKLYVCNADGTKSFITSTPIVNGRAAENLQLLEQQYSYEVVIGGGTYTDPVTYTRCHVESSSSVTFTVDITDTGAIEYIGLNNVNCRIDKSGPNTLRARWQENQELPGEYLPLCVVAKRSGIKKSTVIYNQCTNESQGYDVSFNLPTTGNKYIVSASLVQGGSSVSCGNNKVFNFQDDGVFSRDGLLATIFLTLTLGTMFISNGAAMIIAFCVGIILAWFIGFLILDSTIISSILILVFMILLIARLIKK